MTSTSDGPGHGSRVLSGVQPSGDLHLGNYLGAFRNWVALQHDHDAFYCIVDLHALTLDIDPAELRSAPSTRRSICSPPVSTRAECTLFVQSQVPEHPRLAWLLECTATMGELPADDPVQGEGRGPARRVRVGLFTYPVLMAADILLYHADQVPGRRRPAPAPRAGPDSWPSASTTATAPPSPSPRPPCPGWAPGSWTSSTPSARCPSRSTPRSAPSGCSTIRPRSARKVKRAVTDTDGEVRYDPAAKPGLSNLLALMAAAPGRTPEEVAKDYDRYGDLKTDLADALVELLPAGTRAAGRAARGPRDRAPGPGRRGGAGPRGGGRHLRRAAEAIGLLSL